MDIIVPIDICQTTPVDVVGLGSGVESVQAGVFHTCAVLTSGAVRCWGQNAYGELGGGTFPRSLVPVEMADMYGYLPLVRGEGEEP